MKSTLYLKFIFIYIFLGFMTIFTVSMLDGELYEQHLLEKNGTALCREANILGTDYLPEYFSGDQRSQDVNRHLWEMSSYMDASIWFVDSTGRLISAATYDTLTPPPAEIAAFDPAEMGSQSYLRGNYHNLLRQEVITVIAPVTMGFTTKGYVLFHKPFSLIEKEKKILMRYAYLTAMLLYILSFSILIALRILVFQPLRRITEAATQYAQGNLEYEIPVNTQDEMGYLSASLNYMSNHLRDIEDYQKNFIANVSHDFRSPLTSIKGYVEAIADGTIPPELQDKYLKIILFETERLTDLTRDLLTLNEFDRRELLLDKTNFNIHEVIKATAASFERRCFEKKIQIQLLFAAPSLLVYADQGKIQQVLYNLLDNAIKFSPVDSDIIIETTERGDKVFISVKDEGMGIPQKNLSKIWDRFYKSDLSRGKDKKGTGLGLSIVKEAITAHDENINVISTEGVGTEFTFSLPKGTE